MPDRPRTPSAGLAHGVGAARQRADGAAGGSPRSSTPCRGGTNALLQLDEWQGGRRDEDTQEPIITGTRFVSQGSYQHGPTSRHTQR